MNLFTKTFFRFALGFIGILMFSAAVIVVGNTLHTLNAAGEKCVNCAGN